MQSGRQRAVSIGPASENFLPSKPQIKRSILPVRCSVISWLGGRGSVKRGMSVAARKRERQQHDQTAQDDGSLHRKEHNSEGSQKFYYSRIAQAVSR